MTHTLFGACLVISILVLLWMVSRNYNTIDLSYWTIVCIIPIIILGYWMKTEVTTSEAASITFCFIYLDSTVLLTVMLFLMLRTIGIKVSTWIKTGGYALAFLHLYVVWSSVHNQLYFRSISITSTVMGNVTKMTDGPLRIFHYIYLAIILLALIGIIVMGFIRKGTYSHKNLMIYIVITVSGMVMYAIECIFDFDFSLLPYIYVIGDVLVARTYDHIHAHDISCIIPHQQKEYGVRGFAAFDLRRNFLSCNSKIFSFWPELEKQKVDEPLPEDSPLRRVFYTMIDAYEVRNATSYKFKLRDMTCVCEISPFSMSVNNRIIGYFFDVRDASDEQKALDIMASYNESLNSKIAAKTENILAIQHKIVTGMANMIENRDNNTGGHVKRTSDIIRIIIDEIKQQRTYAIDDGFAKDIIRAAPMHDLGKVTIENSILNKPDKLTVEEFEIMKTHAAKSGEMVMILLDGVEEEHFVKMAFHVARYHHERWDGRGYPEQLVGSMIPLEARIMAVADVYDALACKRSYKEAMDPKLVAKLMMEGMGTQFDPALRPVFLGCRERLEAYYHEANQE